MGNYKAMIYSGELRHSETFYGHNRILIKRDGIVVRADDEECISAPVEGITKYLRSRLRSARERSEGCFRTVTVYPFLKL